MKNWLPQLFSELSLPQKWLLGVGFVLLSLFLVVVPPFQKPDEQTHFFRAIGVARGNFVCSKNQQGVFQNHIPAYLARLPEDAYVSHLAFNDEVKFSWKVFLANANHPATVPAGASLMVNTPKACSLPFVMYLPMAAVLALPVWLQADPVLIFFLGRLTQTLVAVGLWLLALFLTPKKLRLVPLLMLIIPMVPHQLSSYSKDALHLSSGMVAIAVWLRLLEQRLVVLTKFSPTRLARWQRQQLWLLLGLVVAVGVVVLSRPQYGFWLLLPLAVLPAPVHGKLARSVKKSWPRLIVGAGIVTTLALFTLSLRSEMYSADGRAMGALTESATGIYPGLQLQYLLSYPLQIVAIANQTINQYGIFYLVSMVGQLGWLDNTMYWFVIGGVFGGLVGVLVKVKLAVPVFRWWQLLIVVIVVVGTLAGVFSSLYLYGSPVASPIVEAVQGRYFLLLIPLCLVLAAQFNWQRQRWVGGLILFGLVVSIVVATLVRYYAFDDYYYLQSVPQTVFKTIKEDGEFQARLQLEVGKKLRGVVLADQASTTSAALTSKVTTPYLVQFKDANCQEVVREVVVDHRLWQKGKIEVLFPATLIVDSSGCVEVSPYGVSVPSDQQVQLPAGQTIEVMYVH